MPIVSIDVRDGDPTVQVSGQHRGTVTATFADGRVVNRNLRAAGADDWLAQLAGVSTLIQAETEQRDAQSAVNLDTEIAAKGEASEAQVAVAYVRQAWEEAKATDGYILSQRLIRGVIITAGRWKRFSPF